MRFEELGFSNCVKFSPAMLHNHLWRRLNNKVKPDASHSKRTENQQVDPPSGLKSLARIKTQHLGKKRVSFRQDTLLKRAPSFEESQMQKLSSEFVVQETLTPSVETVNSILLFVDISGFTRLCTQLSPETTRFHINTYFTMMMDIIFKYGGDVHKFLGDCIMVIWPISIDASIEETRKTALTALSCAFGIVNSECSRYNKKEGDIPVSLRLHIGLTYGVLHCYHVGTNQKDNNVWEYLVAGKPLPAMSTALDDANHGEIGLSPSFYNDLVQDYCIAKELPTGNYIVSSFKDEVTSQFFPFTLQVNKEKGSVLEFMQRQQTGDTYKALPFKNNVVLEAVYGMVPGVARLHCSNNSLQFLSELRKVTILFINIQSLVPSLDAGDLPKVQYCMEILSGAVFQQQGTFVQFVYDDKGVVAIAAFGLPGRSHENDVHRGLHCAISLHSQLDAVGLPCHIGVTTGNVYCGLVGSTYRCAFGVMGASMNLAARLMGACMKMSKKRQQDGGRNVYILCNETVQQEALKDPNCSFTFENLEPVKAKGYDKPVNIFIPRKRMLRTDSKKNFIVSSIVNDNKFYYNAEVDEQEKSEMRGGAKLLLSKNTFVGRAKEMKYLRTHVIEADDQFRIIFILGTAGIGKSALLRFFAKACIEKKECSILSLRGDGDSLGLPLSCWGHVVRTAVKVLHNHLFPSVENQSKLKKKDITQDPSETMKTLTAVLDARFKNKLLLLAPFFPSMAGIPLSSDLKNMQSSKQGLNIQIQMTIDILIKHIKLEDRKTVLMIEDIHYLDKSSWALIQQMTEVSPKSLSIVCTSRPLSQKQQIPSFVVEGYTTISNDIQERCKTLELGSLRQDACTQLLERLFEIPTDFAKSHKSLPRQQSKDGLMRTQKLDTIREDGDLDDMSITSLNSCEDGYDSDEAETRLRKLKIVVQSEKFSTFVYERCNGNPLFLLGLAEVIQGEFEQAEAQSLEVESSDPVDRFYERIFDVLPENIHAVVTARFDRLSTVAQLALKTASVIGFIFTSSMIKEVFHDKTVTLDESLEELVVTGFLQRLGRTNKYGLGSSSKKHNVLHGASFDSPLQSRNSSEENGFTDGFEYSFEHRLVFDSIQKLLMRDQKAMIHANLGKYFERRYLAFQRWSRSSTDLMPRNSFHLKRLRSKRFSDLDVKKLSDDDDIDSMLSYDGGSQSEMLDISEEELESLSLYELHLKLAYNWSRTYELEKAAFYLKKAATYTINAGAYTEAEELLVIALHITSLRLAHAGIDIDAEIETEENAKLSYLSRSSTSTDLKRSNSSGSQPQGEDKLNMANELRKVRSLDNSPSAEAKLRLRRFSTLSSIPSAFSRVNSSGDNDCSNSSFKTLSFKDILSEGIMLSAEKAAQENVERLLVTLTEDLCSLASAYTRYRVTPRDNPRLQVNYMISKAHFAQLFLKRHFSTNFDDEAMSLVLHCTAYNHFGKFGSEFDSYISNFDEIQQLDFSEITVPLVPIPSAETIESSFDQAIRIRKSSQDFVNTAESLNGLGTFYQMFLLKVKASTFLVGKKIMDKFLNEAAPTFLRGKIRQKLSLIWAPLTDKSLYDILCQTLFDEAEAAFLECRALRELYCPQELGQVENSLGTFYLLCHDDLKKAKMHFDRSVEAYTVTQGNRNPRSAYALDGLARCYEKESYLFAEEGRLEKAEKALLLSYSLCSLCLELRKLTETQEDRLYIKCLLFFDSLTPRVVWPWNRQKSVNLLLSNVFKNSTTAEGFACSLKAHVPEVSYFVGWSSRFTAPIEKQQSRTILSFHCFFWIYNNQYQEIVDIQLMQKSFRKNSQQGQLLKAGANKVNVLKTGGQENCVESSISPQTLQKLERAKSWHFLPLSTWEDKNDEVTSKELSQAQFDSLRSFLLAIVDRDDIAEVLLSMVAVSNLFVVEDFIQAAEEFLMQREASATDDIVEVSDVSDFDFEFGLQQASERAIIVKVISDSDACQKFLPTVARLERNQQAIIKKGFSSGFDLRQLISLESVPGSLKGLKRLAVKDPVAFDIYITHMVLDLAGYQADMSMKGSLALQYEFTERLLQVLSLLDLLKSELCEKEVYTKYLGTWSLCGGSVIDATDQALVRLCGMIKAYGEEQINLVQDAFKLLSESEKDFLTAELGRNGLDDGWAIVPQDGPRLLSLFVLCVDEIDVEEVGEFDENQDLFETANGPLERKPAQISGASIALSFGLQLLVKVFKTARVILNQSRLQEQSLNGVYVVRTAHLAKEHVVRTILKEEKFVKFSIFHQDRTGEIVLGDS